MRFTKTSEYAIRAMVYMVHQGDRPCSANRIHQALGIPYKYLGRLLRSLAEQGLLEATRGKAGGYRIKGDKSKILLADILQAVEGLEDFRRCILGYPTCSDENPCALHRFWAGRKESIEDMIDTVSLADLAVDEEE